MKIKFFLFVFLAFLMIGGIHGSVFAFGEPEPTTGSPCEGLTELPAPDDSESVKFEFFVAPNPLSITFPAAPGAETYVVTVELKHGEKRAIAEHLFALQIPFGDILPEELCLIDEEAIILALNEGWTPCDEGMGTVFEDIIDPGIGNILVPVITKMKINLRENCGDTIDLNEVIRGSGLLHLVPTPDPNAP